MSEEESGFKMKRDTLIRSIDFLMWNPHCNVVTHDSIVIGTFCIGSLMSTDGQLGNHERISDQDSVRRESLAL